MRKYIIELKNRGLLLFLTYLSTIIVSYYYKNVLLFLILKPNNILQFNNKFDFFYFIFTDVTEIFSVYFNLIFFLSSQIILLMLLYHLFLFFSPAFYKNEFKYFKLIIKSVTFLSFVSLLVASFIVIPLSWDFFLSFQDLLTNKSFNIHFEAKLIEYFNFYITLYYICGIYFQCFLMFFFILSYINSYKKIKNFRKVFYFCFVGFSALICPEVFSQILLSFLFIIVYELFLFIYLTSNYLYVLKK
jgi:sec-independent protein translocase protein TatC